VKFKQTRGVDGAISNTEILYTDENGVEWTVPEGHRFWLLYQDWLAKGNAPESAA
jgi:hypothetical protein